ncbi:MAG: hypothetical protein COA39_011665 [Sulfurimonas sp.]|nr:hypothetical protein [Sulfurimonas sp.]
MVVGTNCCDNLTGTNEASQIRKFTDRLERFYKSPRWKEKGDNYLIIQKQIEIKIYKEKYRFKINMGTTKGNKTYNSIKEAKKKVFEFIDSGEADSYFMYRCKNA